MMSRYPRSVSSTPRLLRNTRRDSKRLHRQNTDIEDPSQRPITCPEMYHQREAVNLYCDNCRECICQKCRDESHRSHYVCDVYKAARRGKRKIEKAVKKARHEIVDCEDEMEENTSILQRSEEQVKAARRKVAAIVDELIEGLKSQKKALFRELDELGKQYHESHATRQNELRQRVSRLKSIVEYGNNVLERDSSVEIMNEKHKIVSHCEDLLNSSDTLFDISFLNYVIDEEAFERFRLSGVGRLVVSDTDPSQCKAQGKGLKKLVVGEESNISVLTKDSRGDQCYDENDEVEINVQTPLGAELDKELKDTNDGEYEVTFTPESIGQHKVMISVNGQPLANSPRIIQVEPHQYELEYKLGTKIKERDDFDDTDDGHYIFGDHIDSTIATAKDVAISQVTGNIAVLDYIGIKLYNPHGKYLNHFGTRCTNKRLKNPRSVAVSCSGDIIVIDRETITQCTEKGTFVRHFRVRTKSPCSVSVARDGRVILCDSGDAMVKILSPNGENLLNSFGYPKLTGSPSFAIHHEDKFYVSYQTNHCVLVFSNDGKILYKIGGKLTVDTVKGLDSPLGLVVDKFNSLIVCDTHASRLQVFTLEGEYLTTIRGFASPQYVAVSKDGHLYVADERDFVVVWK